MTTSNVKYAIAAVFTIVMLMTSMMDMAYAAKPEKTLETRFFSKDAVKVTTQDATADSGTITCASYVTPTSKCTGYGTGLGSTTYQEQPVNSWYTHTCNGGTVLCVTLNWYTKGYGNSIYNPNTNKIYYWNSGNTYSCSTNYGCTNVATWTQANQSPNINIVDAPRLDPITTHTTYVYRATDGSWASYHMHQVLSSGYG